MPDKNKAVESLHIVESEIMGNRDYEIGVVIDRDGKELYRCDGQRGEVDAPPDDLVKNNTFTHNHPSGNCAFSGSDVYNIVKQDGYELRTVTFDGRFVSLKRISDVWDANILRGFREVSGYRLYVKASQVAQTKHSGRATAAQISKTAEDIVNAWFRDNAVKYGCVFSEGRV